MKVPHPFKGEHDDMDRFLSDCTAYFEVHHHQFQGVLSFMVVFATSHFKDHAEDWWTHRRKDLWIHDYRDAEGPQYHYPHWDDFVREFREQFCDHTVKEQHEKRMKELRMGSDPATIYFQKLERKASLAGQRDDTGPRGHMVAALCAGVPNSFMSIIANIGMNIPYTYDDWKERILIMYEEHEKNRAYNQANGIEGCIN